MKHIRLFEDYINNDLVLVKCNWCGWYGKENELSEDNNNYKYCPNCGDDNYLMDIKSDEPIYQEYINQIKYNL